MAVNPVRECDIAKRMKNGADVESTDSEDCKGQGVSLSVTRKDETAGRGDCAGNAANSRRQQTGYGCGRSPVYKL